MSKKLKMSKSRIRVTVYESIYTDLSRENGESDSCIDQSSHVYASVTDVAKELANLIANGFSAEDSGDITSMRTEMETDHYSGNDTELGCYVQFGNSFDRDAAENELRGLIILELSSCHGWQNEREIRRAVGLTSVSNVLPWLLSIPQRPRRWS